MRLRFCSVQSILIVAATTTTTTTTTGTTTTAPSARRPTATSEKPGAITLHRLNAAGHNSWANIVQTYVTTTATLVQLCEYNGAPPPLPSPPLQLTARLNADAPPSHHPRCNAVLRGENKRKKGYPKVVFFIYLTVPINPPTSPPPKKGKKQITVLRVHVGKALLWHIVIMAPGMEWIFLMW